MSVPLTSFVPVPPGSHFPLENLPFGVFRPDGGAAPRVGVALGDHVIDLAVLSDAGVFSDCGHLDGTTCFHNRSLNEFMGMGRGAWTETRTTLQHVLSADSPRVQSDAALRAKAVLHKSHVQMELPAEIGNYTDFYSSREHATNAGALFRSRETALQPNWLHMPVGYHSRASSVVLSGTPIVRPLGQLGLSEGETAPAFGPCQKLDYELEMGVLVGPGNEMSEAVPVHRAEDHAFGMVIVNDWSARDIQRWEYVPLGPFLSKSFATSISPWVVTFEALEPFKCSAPSQDPAPLPYLTETDRHTYDIKLEVELMPHETNQGTVLARSNFRKLYWTISQQIAHHTVGGCNLRPGDLLGSGTISSGSDPGEVGCLLEATQGGKSPVAVSGQSRTWLEDEDTVVLRAYCEGTPTAPMIGFGECVGRIHPPLVNPLRCHLAACH